MSYLSIFCLGWVVSSLGILLIIRTPRLRAVSGVSPTEDRWHIQITPGLGGVPMFLGFVCVFWIGSGVADAWMFGIFSSACILFVVGLIDDIHRCGPGIKLSAQCFAAGLVVLTGSWSIPLAEHQWFGVLVQIVWIVAISNGVNLLDNMDGLAGGVALIAAMAVVILLSDVDGYHQYVRLMLVGLTGALAGFLIFNVNPAKIFMGDSGSQWIGLVIGASTLSLLTTESVSDVAMSRGLLVPLLILSVPLLDTSFVIITRKMRGQAASQGGRDHLSHRLVVLGCSERSSVAILWLLAVAGSITAYALVYAQMLVWLPILLAFIVCLVVIVVVALRAVIPEAAGH